MLFGDSNEKTLEIVFHDKEGGKLHSTVKNCLINQFKPLFEEGHIYVVRNFYVGSNFKSYKTTTHKYKINFIAKTQVIEVFDESFPSHIYSFKLFRDILSSPKPDPTELFDVIGVVVESYNIVTKVVKGNNTSLLDFVLQDKEKNRIPVTLWGDSAIVLSNFIQSNVDQSVIVILQYCRALDYNVIKLSSAFDVTKLLINPDIEEVHEYKKSLLLGETPCDNKIVMLKSKTDLSIDEDIVNGGSRMLKIDRLSSSEVGRFWVYAAIEDIMREDGWYYVSCKKCPKKVIKMGSTFYCEKCDRDDNSASIRYKLSINVIDDSANANFVLFDNTCVQLLGKSAADLLDIPHDTTNQFPHDIENIIGKKVLFKVEVKNENIRGRSNSYTVIRLTDDYDVISKHICFLDLTQESGLISEFEKTEDSNIISKAETDKTGESSTFEEVSTPTKNCEPSDSREPVDECSTKRNLSGDMSSNVPLKKVRSVIKIEKN